MNSVFLAETISDEIIILYLHEPGCRKANNVADWSPAKAYQSDIFWNCQVLIIQASHLSYLLLVFYAHTVSDMLPQNTHAIVLQLKKLKKQAGDITKYWVLMKSSILPFVCLACF